ncbi:hypothetical protein BDF21DRAFT_24050 [Thamnidium elegans]|nr:hypothetical protein BDF21DRAFT_24050 [Thamnidium elegans]
MNLEEREKEREKKNVVSLYTLCIYMCVCDIYAKASRVMPKAQSKKTREKKIIISWTLFYMHHQLMITIVTITSFKWPNKFLFMGRIRVFRWLAVVPKKECIKLSVIKQ